MTGRSPRKSPKTLSAHRAPKQERSRASFERLISTAIDMIKETGRADFTLLQVSRRAKVSISSIYYRVKNREDLIRIVQQRANELIDQQFGQMIARVKEKPLPFQRRVVALVRGMAEVMRDQAALFSVMTELAAKDPLISAAGEHCYAIHLREWSGLILELRAQISHPEPEEAAHFAFDLVVDVLAHKLSYWTSKGLEVNPHAWRKLVNSICVACVALLEVDPKSARNAIA